MQNNNSKIKFVIIGLFILLIVLVAILSMVISRSADPDASGILKPRNTTLQNQDELDTLGQDEDKILIGEDFEQNFKLTVANYLSLGEWAALENYLKDVTARYEVDPENEYITIDYIGRANSYLSDVSTLRTIQNGKYFSDDLLDGLLFSDTLASAYVYLPVSKKLNHVLNSDSMILPGVIERAAAVALSEEDLDLDQKDALLKDINGRRIDPANDIAVYTYRAYGRICKLTLVREADYFWRIYKMDFIDGFESPITVGYLQKKIVSESLYGREFDVDSFFVVEE